MNARVLHIVLFTDTDSSFWSRVLGFSLTFVCLFIHVISQKPLQLVSPNLT